jgi:hypothetical protein
MPQSSEESILIPAVFSVDPSFLCDLLRDEGVEISREEEAKLHGQLTEIRIVFEVDLEAGEAWVLGAR